MATVITHVAAAFIVPHFIKVNSHKRAPTPSHSKHESRDVSAIITVCHVLRMCLRATCQCSGSSQPSASASADQHSPSPPWCWSWRYLRIQSRQCSLLTCHLDLRNKNRRVSTTCICTNTTAVWSGIMTEVNSVYLHVHFPDSSSRWTCWWCGESQTWRQACRCPCQMQLWRPQPTQPQHHVLLVVLSRYQNYDFDTIPVQNISRPILKWY